MTGDAVLAGRLEAFQADIIAADATDVLRIGEGPAVFAGVGSPLTQAINIDRDAERVEKFFFDRGADSIIQATPWSSPVFLASLASRGYTIHEWENVFARDLSGGQAPPPVQLDIRLTNDIDTWARIAAESFATPEMSEDFLVGVMKPFGESKNTRCYLAYIDGEAAGSASMIVSRERKVVGLFGAATRKAFRRRGVQTALLNQRLRDAMNEGCEIAIVTTQPGSDSHRNVARRGFELMYTKISMRKSFAS